MWRSGGGRSRFARAWDWVRSRRLVGEDEHHFYYCEFIAKDKPERRYVEFKDRNITHSSDRMAIEWWSWLHNRRDSVPTKEEMAASERARKAMAERVAILEAEDERQRLRESSSSNISNINNVNVDIVATVLLDNNNNEEEESKYDRRRRKTREELQKAAGLFQHEKEKDIVHRNQNQTTTNGGEFKQERNVSEDPKGMGDDFQPGSWKPSSSRRR